MNDRVAMSKTWIFIIIASVIIFILGRYFYQPILEVTGAIGAVGALTCGLTGVIIKYLRRKRRNRE
ncbi:hypothetical protein [Lactococcus allomyrinae]|uniref:Uncharacterized protein n=1 Tax=Lactococcus allomyrinae TaxID=2419773 RepID=A0A387BDU0_9LACT|nr:hypothetical protein [Lactococcus allomyrinae]AYG00424.1 hypothetical protein D7I46_04550 [Lactococcus allomyrinae]